MEVAAVDEKDAAAGNVRDDDDGFGRGETVGNLDATRCIPSRT